MFSEFPIGSPDSVGESAYDVRFMFSDFLQLLIEPPPAKNGETPTPRLLTGRVETLRSGRSPDAGGTCLIALVFREATR